MKRQHRGPGSPRAAAAAIPGQAPAALGPPSRGAGAPGQASPRPAGGGGLAGRYLGQPALVVRVLAAQHPLQLVHAARPGPALPLPARGLRAPAYNAPPRATCARQVGRARGLLGDGVRGRAPQGLPLVPHLLLLGNCEAFRRSTTTHTTPPVPEKSPLISTTSLSWLMTGC